MRVARVFPFSLLSIAGPILNQHPSLIARSRSRTLPENQSRMAVPALGNFPKERITRAVHIHPLPPADWDTNRGDNENRSLDTMELEQRTELLKPAGYHGLQRSDIAQERGT